MRLSKMAVIVMLGMFAFSSSLLKSASIAQAVKKLEPDKLLAEDKELQDSLKKMQEAGVELFACKACADIYGVAESLSELGIDVKYMGVPLTEILKKSDWKTITF